MAAKHVEAFLELKSTLVNAPVLVHPLDDVKMELQIDASQKGLGGALLQSRIDGPHPIAFISRPLTDAEKNHYSNELEYLTLEWALKSSSLHIWTTFLGKDGQQCS
jgi:hypothetical protein